MIYLIGLKGNLTGLLQSLETLVYIDLREKSSTLLTLILTTASVFIIIFQKYLNPANVMNSLRILKKNRD